MLFDDNFNADPLNPKSPSDYRGIDSLFEDNFTNEPLPKKSRLSQENFLPTNASYEAISENIINSLMDLQTIHNEVPPTPNQGSEISRGFENPEVTAEELKELRVSAKLSIEASYHPIFHMNNLKYLTVFLKKFFPGDCIAQMKELCRSEKSKENLQLLQTYATLHILYDHIEKNNFKEINIAYDTSSKRLILYSVFMEFVFIAMKIDIPEDWQQQFNDSFVKYHSDFASKQELLGRVAEKLKNNQWRPKDHAGIASFVEMLSNRSDTENCADDFIKQIYRSSALKVTFLNQNAINAYKENQNLFIQFLWEKNDHHKNLVINSLYSLEKYIVFHLLELCCENRTSQEKYFLFSEMYKLYDEMQKMVYASTPTDYDELSEGSIEHYRATMPISPVFNIEFHPASLIGNNESRDSQEARKIIEYCINNHNNIANVHYTNLLDILELKENSGVFSQFFYQGCPLNNFLSLKEILADMPLEEVKILLEWMEESTRDPEKCRNERKQREACLKNQLNEYTVKLLPVMRHIFNEYEENFLILFLQQIFYYSNGPRHLELLEAYLEQKILFGYLNSLIDTDNHKVLNSVFLEYNPVKNTVTLCFYILDGFFEAEICPLPEWREQLQNINSLAEKNRLLLLIANWYCMLPANKYYDLSLEELSRALSGEYTPKVSKIDILNTLASGAKTQRTPACNINTAIIINFIQWWLQKEIQDPVFSARYSTLQHQDRVECEAFLNKIFQMRRPVVLWLIRDVSIKYFGQEPSLALLDQFKFQPCTEQTAQSQNYFNAAWSPQFFMDPPYRSDLPIQHIDIPEAPLPRTP